MRRVVLFLLLAACDDGVVGDTNADGLAVGGVSVTSCDSGDTVCSESFGVATAGVGGIHVTDGILKNCCTDVTASAALDGSTIALDYSESGEQCDCVCGHIAEYDIQGLSPGDYTVSSPEGESASITVQ